MSMFLRELTPSAAADGPAVEWEEADCLLCGGRNWTTLVEAPDNTPGGTGLWFAVVQCHDCGLCFTNPRPTAASIGRFYPSQYGPHRSAAARPGRRRLWRAGRRERRLLPWHGRGRLLDFGCGGGRFLERMQRQGWHCLGLDTSAEAVRCVQQELRIPALTGSLPHPRLKAASFDVITMWHSLEHVHRPMAVLSEARRLLAPGGKLYVAVPNIDSLPFRWFGHAWYGLDLPRHLIHFAPWTLHLMLVRAGFRVGPIEMVRHSDWLRSSARLACQGATERHWYRWLKLKTTSRLTTWYSYLTQQSDCILATAVREDEE